MQIAISCKLYPVETICMKYQCLFSWKNKKTIISLSSADFTQRVINIILIYRRKNKFGLCVALDVNGVAHGELYWDDGEELGKCGSYL